MCYDILNWAGESSENICEALSLNNVDSNESML